MTYYELIQTYDLRLDDTHDTIKQRFTPHQLANGWQWWSDQLFSSEGKVTHKATGRIFRVTTTQETRNRLIYAIYKIGPEVPSHVPADREHLPACNQRVEDGRGVNVAAK